MSRQEMLCDQRQALPSIDATKATNKHVRPYDHSLFSLEATEKRGRFRFFNFKTDGRVRINLYICRLNT